MKKTFLLISDTHGIINIKNEIENYFKNNNISFIDYLIHAGDRNAVNPFMSMLVRKAIDTELRQIEGIRDKFGNIIQTVGNHDSLLDIKSNPSLLFPKDSKELIKRYASDIVLSPTLFEDGDITFFITPTSPKFGEDWGFFEENWTDELNCIYEEKKNIDVIISHAPPKGYGDSTEHGKSAGSVIMNNFINKFEPKLFVCGHIHEARGIYKHENGKTIIVNASVINSSYIKYGSPIFMEIDF